MNQIIDFDRKGNVVRFYLGENGKQWGDDWNDVPYEHNAGGVYKEFVESTKDIVFGFDDIVYEPSDGYLNSKWSKQDMIDKKVPCIVVLPYGSELNYFDYRFEDVIANKDAKKYYFGDELA